MILNGDSCRAIERVGHALKYRSLSSFLLTFDLSLELPVSYIKKYENADDDLGATCLTSLKERYNGTIQGFGKEMSRIRDEKKIVQLYLGASEFLGRPKRAAGAVIMAAIVTVSNLAATGFNIAYTSMTLNGFDNRLQMLADKVKMLEENQSIMQNNIELLYEKEEFLGVQKNLLLNYINQVKTVHSCNIVGSEFESQMHRLESDLENIVSALHSNKFLHNLVDFKTLELLTQQSMFRGTIYQIAPTLLFDHAILDLVSFGGNKLTFLITFPHIGDEYEFAEYDIVEAPQQIGFLQDNNYHNSFLMPESVEFDDLQNHVEDIRSSEFCKRKPLYSFCPSVSQRSNCIASVLKNENVSENCPLIHTSLQQPSISYGKSGALINLNPNEDVIDLKTGNSIIDFDDKTRDDSICIFVPKRSKLVLRHQFGQVKLFPRTRIESFEIKPKFKPFKPMKKQMIENLTLDTFHSTKMYKQPKNVYSFYDFWIVYAIAIGSSVLITLLIMAVLLCIVRRFWVVDGRDIFT